MSYLKDMEDPPVPIIDPEAEARGRRRRNDALSWAAMGAFLDRDSGDTNDRDAKRQPNRSLEDAP